MLLLTRLKMMLGSEMTSALIKINPKDYLYLHDREGFGNLVSDSLVIYFPDCV